MVPWYLVEDDQVWTHAPAKCWKWFPFLLVFWKGLTPSIASWRETLVIVNKFAKKLYWYPSRYLSIAHDPLLTEMTRFVFFPSCRELSLASRVGSFRSNEVWTPFFGKTSSSLLALPCMVIAHVHTQPQLCK